MSKTCFILHFYHLIISRLSVTNRSAIYPTMVSFPGLGEREHHSSYVDSPWFYFDGIRNPEVWCAYFYAVREVTDEITERALESF